MQRILASQSTLVHGAAPRWPLLIDAVEQLASASTLEQVVDVVRASARGIAAADGITFVMREDHQCHYVAEDAIMPLWQGRRFPTHRVHIRLVHVAGAFGGHSQHLCR